MPNWKRLSVVSPNTKLSIDCGLTNACTRSNANISFKWLPVDQPRLVTLG
jgi:hypothetical protein